MTANRGGSSDAPLPGGLDKPASNITLLALIELLSVSRNLLIISSGSQKVVLNVQNVSIYAGTTGATPPLPDGAGRKSTLFAVILVI